MIENFSLDCDDKLDKQSLEDNNPPCMHSDGFCKPTIKHPKNFKWIREGMYLLFHISDIIGGKFKLNICYW